jgi:hypothetical protein
MHQTKPAAEEEYMLGIVHIALRRRSRRLGEDWPADPYGLLLYKIRPVLAAQLV